MARQNTTPVVFDQTIRVDEGSLMTSGRAGKVLPLVAAPLLRGDSCSGSVTISGELGNMPRPLQNAVLVNCQAWCVPKGAHPQFTGSTDLMNAYTGDDVKRLSYLGEIVENAPPYFFALSTAAQKAICDASEFFRTLGIHVPQTGPDVNTDYIDAFALVYNFRLAAHSSRLEKHKYAVQGLNAATTLPRAFWPKGRLTKIVPDYERALVVGDLSVDVVAGQLPLSGLALHPQQNGTTGPTLYTSEHGMPGSTEKYSMSRESDTDYQPSFRMDPSGFPDVYAELGGQAVAMTLADIDKARVTQAFALLRASMAGNDATGFDNDDAILATLMQGLVVPDADFKRPWLLDSQVVAITMVERHALDGPSLEQSTSQGMWSARLGVNVPRLEEGGTIIVTMEVVPERLDERQSDEFLTTVDPAELPNALRDVQRPEPVDQVLNRRLDARHSQPDGIYGFEPMNDKWNRSVTRLGGDYFQDDPNAPWTEQRSAIWQTSIVDPAFTEDHWLCPADLPHDVFSDTQAPAFECVVRHSFSIRGLTQIGDVLAENNDDYDAITIAEEIV